MGQITTIGLDLAKKVFQIHAVDASGAVVLRRALRRGKVLEFFAGLPGRHGSMRNGTPLGP